MFRQRNPYASVAVLPAVLSSASDADDLILYCSVVFTARHSLLYSGGSESLCYSIYNLSTLSGEERANFSVDELLIFFMSFLCCEVVFESSRYLGLAASNLFFIVAHPGPLIQFNAQSQILKIRTKAYTR